MSESASSTHANSVAVDESFTLALSDIRRRVEAALEQALPIRECVPKCLHQAMRYATLEGGKRVRAVLVFGAGRALGAAEELLPYPAAAVELIHAYSLVHDDMPCMDDDQLRRGKPTCHVAYGEATALLTGDALQTLAFSVLAEAPMDSSTRQIAMLKTLADASGSLGMAGGQAIDLAAVGRPLALKELEAMHRLKTGALIRASVRLGGLSAVDADDPALDALDQYAACIGLAFQIQDDILDVEGSTEALGKTQGADQALGKPTYPALLGLDESRRRALALHDQGIAAIEPFGESAALLKRLASYIVKRTS